MGIAVRDGEVALAGLVASQTEFELATLLAQGVEGIEGVRNYLIVSPIGARRSRLAASDLQVALTRLWPRASARATVFGQIAMLRGRVQNETDRISMEHITRRVPGVERVINELVVARHAS